MSAPDCAHILFKKSSCTYRGVHRCSGAYKRGKCAQTLDCNANLFRDQFCAARRRHAIGGNLDIVNGGTQSWAYDRVASTTLWTTDLMTHPSGGSSVNISMWKPF